MNVFYNTHIGKFVAVQDGMRGEGDSEVAAVAALQARMLLEEKPVRTYMLFGCGVTNAHQPVLKTPTPQPLAARIDWTMQDLRENIAQAHLCNELRMALGLRAKRIYG